MRAGRAGKLSKSTAARICSELRERLSSSGAASLDDVRLPALFLDAVFLSVRRDGPKEGVLVAWGFTDVTTPTTVEQTRYSIIAIAAFQTVLLIVGLVLVAVTHAAAVQHEQPRDTSADDGRSGDEFPRTGAAGSGYCPHDPPRLQAGRDPARHGRRDRVRRFGRIDQGAGRGVIGDPLAIVSPWTVTALIALLGAFYTSARSLQIGEGIAVITATTSAAKPSTIAGCIIVSASASEKAGSKRRCDSAPSCSSSPARRSCPA